MVIEKEKKECCGCSACVSICPTKALELRADEKGFLYPVVDSSLCVDCGLCEKVCDFTKFVPTKFEPICYMIKHKNLEEIQSSRSGAVFMALCDYVLERGGYICGCELADKNTIIHNIYNTKEGVNKFKGSKYVQSNMRDSFCTCLELLQQGKYVLFSGTGCQVHGFLSFCKLKKINTEKLITCDLVCHGVPSPAVWNYYVEEIEKKTGKTVADIDFRDKMRYGWRNHLETFTFVDHSILTSSIWANNFNACTMFRESCYNCKYTTPNRMTDFTIADCWGVEKISTEFDDDKGVSLLMVRTKKGIELFNSIKKNLFFKEIPLKIVMQPQLVHPVTKGIGYAHFWKLYCTNKSTFCRKYFFPSKFDSLMLKVSYKFAKIFKKN